MRSCERSATYDVLAKPTSEISHTRQLNLASFRETEERQAAGNACYGHRPLRKSGITFIPSLNVSWISFKLLSMGKSKNPATGAGYLGEIMVHRISGAVGVVENVTEAKAGWPPQISLKLADGSLKKGRLSDFREANNAERQQFPAA